MNSDIQNFKSKIPYIRKMCEGDLDILMVNKNKNKKYFFLKEDITPNKQLEWFKFMEKQKDNFMFICLNDDKPFGCMGYRKINNVIDIYNVMRFNKSNISMSECLLEMIGEIKKKYIDEIIQVLVLEDNPAIKWYEKNGFDIIDHKDKFVKMILKND